MLFTKIPLRFKVPETKELSASERQNLIKELPSDVAEPTMKLNKAVAGKSAADFIKILEEESLNVCDVMLKKQDKKKDKQILFSHKHELLDKLGSCEDPALGLHLAALILFQHCTGNIIQVWTFLIDIESTLLLLFLSTLRII